MINADQAENALLGGVLLGGRAELVDVLNVITEADFRRPATRSVFRAMRILESRGEAVDVVTLETQLARSNELELVGGIEGLAKLDRHATPHNIRTHAEMVRQAARERRLIEFGKRLSSTVERGVDDLDGWLAREQAEFRSLVEGGTTGRLPWTAAKVFMDLFDEKTAEAVAQKKDPGAQRRIVSTGFPDLDSMIKGRGLRGGWLVVLGGRPKMGKTSFALSLTRAAILDRKSGWPCGYKPRVDPVPVLWACDEMTAKELMERIVADVAGIDSESIAAPSLEWLRARAKNVLNPVAELIGHTPLSFVQDSDTHHLERIFECARHWRANHPVLRTDKHGNQVRGPAIVVVDYLQRMADLPGMQRESATDRAGAKAKFCKTKAQELDVIVVCLSQLNRSLESRPNKRPIPSDFRDSGEIEQEADVLLAVYRDFIYSEDSGNVYRQIDELTSRSGLTPHELDGVLAYEQDQYLAGNHELAALARRCRLSPTMVEELIAARAKVTDTEILVLANRHGSPGTVPADFYGPHYRFLPKAQDR